jgi:hypothetical protein
MRQPRLFAGVYVFTCVGVLASALAVNVMGNASGLFPSPLFPPLSERAWKTRRLDDAVRADRPPKVIVLGSSRVMQIQPQYIRAITGKAAFNYGVSTATPTDYLTQLRYLLKIGCRPDLVLLGVDESSFHGKRRPEELQTLGHLGLFMEMPSSENLDILAESLRGIDLGTTLRSLSKLVGKKRSNLRRVEAAGNILLEDGYLIYCKHVRKLEDGTFDQAANIAADVGREARVALMHQSLLQPTSEKMDHFEQFLAIARAEGIEVRVVFLPLHPDYERRLFTEELSRARSAMSQNIQRTCVKYGAVYRDFTKLASYGGDPKEFYDSQHQTAINTRRMVNAIVGVTAGNALAAHLPTDSDILKHLPRVTTLTKE